MLVRETANRLTLAEHMAVVQNQSLSWLNLVNCFPSLFPSSIALPLTSAGYFGVWGEVGHPFAVMSERLSLEFAE